MVDSTPERARVLLPASYVSYLFIITRISTAMKVGCAVAVDIEGLISPWTATCVAEIIITGYVLLKWVGAKIFKEKGACSDTCRITATTSNIYELRHDFGTF